MLKTMNEWISNQKVEDLKHLLEDDASTEEGKAILPEQKRLMLLPRSPLLSDTHQLVNWKKFCGSVFPMAHWVAAMNGWHQDAGHQGQQQTLYLLYDQFWWPRMATQMQKAISSCDMMHLTWRHLCQSATMQPIIVTAPLELLHMDFTSIDMTMVWDQPPNMVNILVLCRPQLVQNMSWLMWPLIRLQWLLISFWGKDTSQSSAAPAKLLNDWGANFKSNIRKELCELMGMQKVRTSPYQAQTNGQVEWAHQMLMHMIGKLSKDLKADCPKHLSELAHTYNSVRDWPSPGTSHTTWCLGTNCMLPHWLLFPHDHGKGHMEKHQHVLTSTLLSYMDGCGKPSRKCKCSPYQRLKDRSTTMIERLMPFHWNQVTWP